MKIVAFIPARYASSRFPGKPLVELADKPMIVWAAEAAGRALGKHNVYVATDDVRIAAAVEKNGFKVVMTPSDLLTGTDRVAVAARQVAADVYLNIQGDEPALDPASILKVVELKQSCPGEVANAMAVISPGEDAASVNLPKVAAAADGRLVYMSRLPVPGSKKGFPDGRIRFKQVCIYAFEPSQLEAYYAFGRKGAVEAVEDIEILRFLEMGIPVRMCEVPAGSLAVDVPEDVPGVVAALRRVHGL